MIKFNIYAVKCLDGFDDDELLQFKGVYKSPEDQQYYIDIETLDELLSLQKQTECQLIVDDDRDFGKKYPRIIIYNNSEIF
jgi:hypothetical protein